MRDVAVLGVGCTNVGEHWGKSLRDLLFEASRRAMEDAGIEGIRKIEGLYVGNMCSGSIQGQEHLGALMADALGISGISACKVEAACGSGGMAFHQGVKAVASGLQDFILVAGVEKLSDASTPEATSALMMAEDSEYSAYVGASFVGLNALIHRLYMKEYGARAEHIAALAANGHNNAVNNQYAQYRFPTTPEKVLASPLVADPIHLLECAGNGDGAAAAIICPLERARQYSAEAIAVAASTTATDVFSLTERADILSFSASRMAAEAAYGRAKIGPQDIDVLEVHDAFTIVGTISLEDLGFVKKGEGAKFVHEGNIAIDGKLPTNTFGGLKARGHPVGATGIYQIAELTWQLRGQAGKNQVEGAEIGLAQNVGGIGSTASVHILRRAG
jgi:acetyl-CoA C-acetyltransferase